MARVTVEDCLEIVPNRFALAMAASHRAKQLLRGAPALVQSKNKFIVTALREIAESKVTIKQRAVGWPNPPE
jgi:DNA-directed RNA polymerase subunit omega